MVKFKRVAPEPVKSKGKVDISTPAKHQAVHDKLDALLHKEKMEHTAKRRAKHISTKTYATKDSFVLGGSPCSNSA